MQKFSVVLASSLLLLACGRSGDSTGDAGTPGKTVTSISLSPATFALAIGGTQGLSVAAVFSDNSTAVITTATFTSSAPAIATVSDTGLVTGVTAGSATITAKQGTVTATATATVNPAGPATSLVVFADDYGNGVSFAPFSGANPTIDTTQHTVGTASLKVVDPATGFTGGAFKLAPSVDASGFNAITFWAMASTNHTVDKFGFGNDTTDSSLEVDWLAVPLTTTWTKFTLPIPAASKLTALTGAFLFATNGGGNFNFWLDQIQYETVTLAAPTAALPLQTLSKGVGDKVTLSGLTATWQINGAAETLSVAPKYFTFTSSNTAVATVDQNGVISCIANGSATITAKLGTVSATGSVTITVAAGNTPATAAPTPTQDSGTVISLFSNAYTNRPVANWNAFGNGPSETDIQIAGNDVKQYGNLTFAGVDISGGDKTKDIDLTGMTFVHVDYWTPDATTFGIKLVDFGANGVFENTNTDDTEAEIDVNAPAKSQWNSLELPLSQFTALTSRAHLGQILFIGSNSTLFIDNVYFHSGGAGSGGTPGLTSFAVFADGFPSGVTAVTAFQSNPAPINTITIDSTAANVHSGTSALKVVVPTTSFAGGAIVLPSTVNLSGTNALTFWAKASTATTIEHIGIGNDANGDVAFQVEAENVALTTTYQQFIIPLPDPSVLTAVKGVFYFSTVSLPGNVTFWLDDVQFGVLSSATLGQGQPAIATETLNKSAGDSFAVDGLSESWFLSGSGNPATSFSLAPAYFSFASSDATVASVNSAGTITAIKAGTANITATFKGAPAAGEISLNIGAQPVPTVAPPRPTAAASTVFSILSDAYTNVPVDTYNAGFSGDDQANSGVDFLVGADHTKKYSKLQFCGIETDSTPAKTLDLTSTGPKGAMTFFHIDIWTPDSTLFKIKLVDFGPNGVFESSGSDDTEAELTFDSSTTPKLVTGQWVSLDIPLSTFQAHGLTASPKHMAQYILSASTATLYIDNVYFHQ